MALTDSDDDGYPHRTVTYVQEGDVLHSPDPWADGVPATACGGPEANLSDPAILVTVEIEVPPGETVASVVDDDLEKCDRCHDPDVVGEVEEWL